MDIQTVFLTQTGSCKECGWRETIGVLIIGDNIDLRVRQAADTLRYHHSQENPNCIGEIKVQGGTYDNEGTLY